MSDKFGQSGYLYVLFLYVDDRIYDIACEYTGMAINVELLFLQWPCRSSGVRRWLPTAAARVLVRSDVGFVVDKAALGQVISEYFGFPCQSFHRFLYYHNHPGLTQQAIKWPQCRVDLDSTPRYANFNFNLLFLYGTLPYSYPLHPAS
jgi:hypothetical protein